ncbi:hypothetical protein [Acidianus bottle-shaped virus]|uniref:Uncharacterized protein ORF174 n=1 Tax=Acidianus bottle-shaped virus (isolate Italy/Pozzuoli) TaxID=654911 RepID=Y174_ABVP|nr:hypothetical protein ABV_gp36 [Acidianus bottle-shaped virus]A4ZUC2.1 RecName: Full=Uncharacterized protein ORF174 [Acidianus bottle-shaped virus (isolate Pozzuoli)]ABP73426.1 hypothetical protein [Acidianus bottle-shaped virus]
MARRHKKSKSDVVQINPDATINYVMGILTGANAYIDGLLSGANMYNAWVMQEMSLEGKPIGTYKPDSLRDYIDNLKNTNPRLYSLMKTDPKVFIDELQKTGQLDAFLGATNYARLAKTDKYMIEAGRKYRDTVPSLVKSKSPDTGLAFLQQYAPYGGMTMARLGNILKTGVKVE